MNKAKERIKEEIECIEDVLALDKIQIFLMGVRAQKNISLIKKLEESTSLSKKSRKK